jgi:NAD(P)-dependent dehydrogenase (short-subunit alcohol dehydrogenase family)/acyl carrier protein
VQVVQRVVAPDRGAEVMEQFQQVMQRFLDTQRSVMLAYLTGDPGRFSPSVAPSRPAAIPRVIETAALPGPQVPASPSPAAPARDGRNGMTTQAAPVTPPAPAAAPAISTPAIAPAPASTPAEASAPPVAGPAAPAAPVQGTGAATAAPAPAGGRRPAAEPAAPAATAALDGDGKAQAPAAGPAGSGASAANGRAAGANGLAAEPAVRRLDREQLTERLLALVSERTGYPPDMLGLDVDLEADLGIDSIKRVEIVGSFVRWLALPDGTPVEMERLTGSRTLQQLLDHLATLVGPPEPATAGAGEDRRPFEFAATGLDVDRFTVGPVAAPAISRRAALSRDGVILITDDESGLSQRLVERLAGQGYRAVRVVAPSAGVAAGTGETTLVADIGQPEDVARVVDELRRRYGPAVALVHLAPLRPGASDAGLDLARWRTRLATDLHGLFLLVKALQPDLERAAGAGGGAVLAASALGGAFASDRPGQGFFPGHGALTGFLKTLAQEWPEVRVKAVDLSPAAPDAAAAWLLAELFAADGLVEVGYRKGQRTMLQMARAPVPPEGARPALPLDRDSVVLLTGGARGITAEAALHLAQRYQPTLVLVGRTPLPAGPEPPETAGLTELGAIKRAIIEQQRRAGATPTPAAVEAAYRRLVSEREVRSNLERLRRAGARVAYFSCDVRDADAFGALLDDLYRTYGRIDGVIHGAGIIEDKLVRDKTLDSLERVVSTKVESAVVLAAKLRPERLRFLVFFSSIAGRLGNRGQADYGAASEILNKLAIWLQAQWPGRVVAIDWGPWAMLGMATPEVQRQFRERGVGLVPPEAGNDFLVAELACGRRGESEVVIAGGPAIRRAAGEAAPDLPTSGAEGAAEGPAGTRATQAPALPLVSTGTLRRLPDGARELRRVLSCAQDQYLDDHRLHLADGLPVLPLAIAVEHLLEVTAAGWPDLAPIGARDLRLLRRVVVDRDDVPLRAVARARSGHDPAPSVELPIKVIDVELVVPADAPVANYRGAIEAAADYPPAPDGASVPALSSGEPFPLQIERAYRDWLFHGPRWQVIDSIAAISAGGLTAQVQPSQPSRLLAVPENGRWVFDPGLLDAAAQLAILWCRWRWGMTSLPAGFQRLRWFAPGAAGPIRCELRVRPGSAPPTLTADYWFIGGDGQVLAAIEGFEHTASASLNALTGQRGSAAPASPTGVGR